MTTDLEKAQEIVRGYTWFVGKHGALRERVASAVVQGIALGRREGLQRATELNKQELDKISD